VLSPGYSRDPGSRLAADVGSDRVMRARPKQYRTAPPRHTDGPPTKGARAARMEGTPMALAGWRGTRAPLRHAAHRREAAIASYERGGEARRLDDERPEAVNTNGPGRVPGDRGSRRGAGIAEPAVSLTTRCFGHADA
jgi:hypothetical protein